MSAVSIARSEYFLCPPRRPVGLALQLATASGVSQKVMLPRWTSERSYSDQLLTQYCVLYFGWTRDRSVGMGRSSWERMTYRPIEAGSCSIHAPTPCVGQHMVHQMGCRIGHAAGAARGAEAPLLARESHELVVPAGRAPDPHEAVREDPAGEERAEFPLDEPRNSAAFGGERGLLEGIDNVIPLPRTADRIGATDGKIVRHQRIGGLLSFYRREAG